MTDYDALRAAAEAATPGPWEWEPPSGDSWPDADESLITVGGEWKTCPHYCHWSPNSITSRGELGKPGHEHRTTETVVSGWGYDACGTSASDEDRAYIAAASPDVVLGLLDRLAAAEDRRWWRSAAATSAHRCQTAWPGNARPTAAMLADYLEACCRDCRVRIAEHALADADAAIDCLARGHDYLARELEAARAALVAHLTLSEAPLTAAAPHSDQPDAHHDGERGGEAGGRA